MNNRRLRQKYSRIAKGAVSVEGEQSQQLDADGEPICNRSNNPLFASILNSRLKRRQVLRGTLATAVTILFGGPVLDGLKVRLANARSPMLGFQAIPVSEADTIVVPAGYTARVILPYGEPITGTFPIYRLDNTAVEQGMQIGHHHDGMHFFPIEGNSPYEGSSTDGLLVINHEYIEPRFTHAAAIGQAMSTDDFPRKEDGTREADQVLKEMNAHGVSITRISRQADGSWAVVQDPRNRRITALTPMEIRGPVRGSNLVRTRYSPDGTRTRGTINNCAHGVTPWNTYLTCEENWARYFLNNDEDVPRELERYGTSRDGTSRYGWELADNGADEYIRFTASVTAASATQDYRHEPNTFGWVVEIDPFDPNSTPVKRTALGRFAHENVIFQPPVEGQPIVCYSGDDARFEYIYKYVSTRPYSKASASGALLDEGILYVARYNEDGSGEWVALQFGQNGLTPENGFQNQANILVNTRTAADFVGATKMDRPEWGAVDPQNGMVYFTLTNNTRRTEAQTDPANPRPQNKWGHIVRWNEGNDLTSPSFTWDLFVLAGPEYDSRQLSGGTLNASNIFACPDGLAFDAERRLWIQTDIGESAQNQGDFVQFGNNQMLVADPNTGEIRRFLTGPIGQEITGITWTPDQRTMFINVQHPGATTTKEDFAAGNINSRWPNQNSGIYPRSATVVITKDDGGVVGT